MNDRAANVNPGPYFVQRNDNHNALMFFFVSDDRGLGPDTIFEA